MEEELISFETAKLAKSVGFDEAIYSDAFDKDGDLVNCTTKHAIYSRPTQSFLQKWIREKYNYTVMIRSTPKDWYWTIQRMSTYRDETHQETFGESITYEQALEVGLVEMLKLIKS